MSLLYVLLRDVCRERADAVVCHLVHYFRDVGSHVHVLLFRPENERILEQLVVFRPLKFLLYQTETGMKYHEIFVVKNNFSNLPARLTNVCLCTIINRTVNKLFYWPTYSNSYASLLLKRINIRLYNCKPLKT